MILPINNAVYYELVDRVQQHDRQTLPDIQEYCVELVLSIAVVADVVIILSTQRERVEEKESKKDYRDPKNEYRKLYEKPSLKSCESALSDNLSAVLMNLIISSVSLALFLMLWCS